MTVMSIYDAFKLILDKKNIDIIRSCPYIHILLHEGVLMFPLKVADYVIVNVKGE